MKNVKVSDEVHAELGSQSKSAGLTMSVLIGKLLSGSVVSHKVDPMDGLSGQIKMMFDLLVEMDGKLDSPKNFSENTKGFNWPKNGESLGEVIPETKQDRFLRIKAEQEELAKKQKHAIEHPEDNDQSGSW